MLAWRLAFSWASRKIGVLVIVRKPLLSFFFCLLLAYLTLFHQLGLLPFFGSDEPRYARVAEEMYESGDFVTPTLDGRPWLEKPPLLYWMEVVSFSMFGFGEWQARLPNAFLALLLAAAVGLFAAKMVRRRLGFMVFLILTTSLLYVGYSRAASTDLPLTAAFTLSMISGFLAIRYGGAGWALICGGALGFAVLAKGFVAIVLFGGCVLLYLLIQNELPWLGRLGLVVAVSCFLVAGPWLGLAWMANGENFLVTFLVNHHLARYVSDLHHHSQPFWYYLPVLLAGFLPWFTFLPAAGRRFWESRRELSAEANSLQVFLWIWACVPFIFFSISTSKLAGYILPILPALSLLVGMEWDRTLEKGAWTKWMRNSVLATILVAVIFSVVLTLGFWLIFRAPYQGLAIGIVILCGLVPSCWLFLRSGNLKGLFLAIAGGAAVSLAAIHTLGAPVVGRFESTEALCIAARPEISAEKPMILYRWHHHTTYYYARGAVKSSPVDDPSSLAEYVGGHPQNSYLILTTQHGRSELGRLKRSELVLQSGNLFLLRLNGGQDLGAMLRALEEGFTD